MPLILRSDRGVETPLAADAHYWLSQQLRERDDGEPLEFSDCFRYGTSKMNQRIESWWQQQSVSTLARWRLYFLELNESGDYQPDNRADRLAFLAIYMPILRAEVQEFVRLWNHHRIRKQRDRPHVVAGIPHMLYHHPNETGGEQCGSSFNSELLRPIQDDLRGFNMDEYLPMETLEWCHETLHSLGYGAINGRQVYNSGERVHAAAYRQLRDAARAHIRTNRMPQLIESTRPLAARRWTIGWPISAPTQQAFNSANQELVTEPNNELEGWLDQD